MPMNFIVAELCINPFCAVLQATVRWVWWVVFSCPGRLLEMEPYLARQQVELEQVRADLNNAGAWGILPFPAAGDIFLVGFHATMNGVEIEQSPTTPLNKKKHSFSP